MFDRKRQAKDIDLPEMFALPQDAPYSGLRPEELLGSSCLHKDPIHRKPGRPGGPVGQNP